MLLKSYEKLTLQNDKTQDEIISYRQKIEQAAYMDTRHIEAAELISLIRTDEEYYDAATTTYMFFSIFWKP